MARSSSFGSRRTTTWVVDQKPRSMTRVVRLGRPANDNLREPNMGLRLAVIALVTALALLALHDWRLI
jgi:hypothetical protein